MKKFLWVLGVIILLVVLTPLGLLYLAPQQATDLSLDVARRLAGLERKTLTLPTGETYVYLEGGQGEPLLLLHGFGANKDNFTLVARHLAPTCHVIIPDHIGFGESSRPANISYAPVAQAERLHRFVKSLGLPRLHIGGSSMGGQIAMTYAALYPDQVQSMWLLDPGGVWSAPPGELQELLKKGVNPLIAADTDQFAGIFSFVMSRPPLIPRPILNVMARERIENIELEKRIFQAIKTDNVEGRIAGLKIPTLIVWGDQDRAINVKTAPVLQRLLPGSRVIIMEGIGHLPMVEVPGAAARDYLAFRSDLS